MFHLDLDSSKGRQRTSSFASVDSYDEHWVPLQLGGATTPDQEKLPRQFEQSLRLDHGSNGAQMNAITEDEEPETAGDESYEIQIDHDYVSSVPDNYVPTHKMTPQDFEPLRVLGKGSYGKVLLVRQRATGKLFAQKQLKKASLVVRQKVVKYTKAERQILEEVRHPFICKLFYAFQDHDRLYLILEYAQGGELFQHLATEKMLPENTVAFYAAELILALSHLHALDIVYRDLKPVRSRDRIRLIEKENCLLDAEGHIMLTDFGLSKVQEPDETCQSFVGTAEYMAPETLLEESYDKSVDWWALGILIYDLLTGSPPFTGNNNAKIIDKILKNKLNLPYYLSPDAKDLITRLLRKQPKTRLGGKGKPDIQTIQKHRFFRKYNWTELESRQVKPPMVPVITQPELAENFSEEFTLLPVHSPHNHRAMQIPQNGDVQGTSFSGFTYVASPTIFRRY